MLKFTFLIMLMTLLGCGRGGTVAGPLGASVGEGNWFCEMAEDGEDWDCIQDPELARAPKPKRLPSADVADLTPVATADEQTLDVQAPPLADEIARANAAVEPSAAPAPPPATTEAAIADPGTELANAEPASVQPTAVDTPILNLPADHYAVQLVAMASASQLDDFIATSQVQGSLTARVERDGELYYVLLLGVYDTRERAEQASLDLPAPLDANEPWIRSVRSIQNAVIRGNTLAASTD